MHSSLTEAVTLSAETMREADGRFHLYTRAKGRVIARATSIKKIVSKRAGHIMPLLFSEVELAEGKASDGPLRYQLADALAIVPKKILDPRIALLVLRLSEEGIPDEALWAEVWNNNLHGTLSVLGFDTMHARCLRCNLPPERFVFSDTGYYCARCSIGMEGIEINIKK